MAAKFFHVEFNPVTLADFENIGPNNRRFIDTEVRDRYMREAIEPGFHALLRQAQANYPTTQRFRIALAISPIEEPTNG